MEDFGTLRFPQRAQRSPIRHQKASNSDANMADFMDLQILLILMPVFHEINIFTARRVSKIADFRVKGTLCSRSPARESHRGVLDARGGTQSGGRGAWRATCIWGVENIAQGRNSGRHALTRRYPPSSGRRIWDPGSTNRPSGSTISKLRTEKTCRIQWSEFQMESYVASHRQKPYLDATLVSRGCQSGA